MKCPKCNKHKAIIDNTYGVLPCSICQKRDAEISIQSKPEFYNISKHNRVTEQRDRHAKDILQPFEKKGKASNDFVDAYPDKVHDYFNAEQLKEL